MEIRTLDFVGVPSRNAKRLRQFYVDALGFRDLDGNDVMLHHRYAPYTDGSQS